MKGYYLSPDALRQAYEDTKYFNVDFQPEDEAVGEDDIYRIKAAKTKEKWQFIVTILSNIKEDENAVQLLRAKCVEEEWLIDAFFKLGKETIEEQQYDRAAVKHLLEQAKHKEVLQRRFSTEFLLDIGTEFKLEIGSNSYISVQNVLDRIAYLLDCYGITYSRYGDAKKGMMCKLSASTIQEYFDVALSNRNSVATVKLKRLRTEQVMIPNKH